MEPFNGLGVHLGNLARVSSAESRSISPENFTGARGAGGKATEGTGKDAARELGVGWKISPSISIPAETAQTIADIEGPGAIQHIWMTVHPSQWRRLLLRCYWDHEETPSIEVPLGDFFASGWCERVNINSLPIAVNPAGGFNSYWEMPFREHARIDIVNLSPEPLPPPYFYYSIDYVLPDVPEDRAYLHAQWGRSNPVPYGEVHTLLDGVTGQGHYVGTYLAWGVNNNGWWGEGEIKFYLDGDGDWPTICGTGEEAYSLAILVADLLDDSLDHVPVRILATDIAGDAIDFARRGIYPMSAVADIPPKLVQRYFHRLDGAYEINKSVRSMVVFGEHDLSLRAPFPRIDLILCRNVLIYFTSDLQRRVLQRFAFSLRPGGLIALGKAESVSPLPDFFVLEHSRLKLFRRNSAIAPVLADRGFESSMLAGPVPTLARRPLVRRLAPSAHTSMMGHSIGEQSIGILDRLSNGVVVVDRTYDIRAINVAARRMLDIRGAGLGEDLIHQVAQDVAPKLREAINSAFAGTPGSATLHLPPDVTHESGRDITVECSAIPSDDLVSSPVLVQIEICDISDFAERTREFEERVNDLESDRTRLQQRANDAARAVVELRSANDAMAAELGRLRADNEQLQLAHEEVQASAEEIETLNEEQQAANEELETLNEELQATIEELNTANSELQSRTEQLETLTTLLEHRSRESDEWFRAVVEEARDYAIFTTDSENRIEFWSPGAESVFGWSVEEAVGQHAEITFTPEDRAEGVPEQEFGEARQSGFAPDVRWHIRRDGTRVFIDGSSRALRADSGAVIGVLKIGQDVTEKHQVNEARVEEDAQHRQELETRVSDATASLRQLSRRLITVQEEERRRLALELHDEIGQMLTALGLQFGARDALTPAELDEVRQTIQELTEQVRQMSMDLRPPSLDRYGLTPSIAWLTERFQRRTGITVELVQDAAVLRFPPAIEITAYRIVQEALTNVARHAKSSDVSVSVVADAQSLVLTVSDAGIGFNSDGATEGSGLGGMRERVALIGGDFSIDAAPEAGTTITATLPVTLDRSGPADGEPETN